MVIWGDDQYENFREDVVPPYCVSAYESFKITVPPGNVWGEPAGELFEQPGHVRGAKHLTTGLIEAGFDAAYAYKPLHHSLGHAFANAVLYLDYNRVGFPYPIVPVAINCYGRKVISQRGGFPNFERDSGRGRSRSARADAEAPVRPRRGDGQGAGRVALARGRARLLRLVARLPDREEPLPLSRHAR